MKGKIVIEYEGDFSLEVSQETIEIYSKGEITNSFNCNKEYEIVLPKNARATVKLMENEITKESEIDNVRITINSDVDKDKLAENLIKTVKE